MHAVRSIAIPHLRPLYSCVSRGERRAGGRPSPARTQAAPCTRRACPCGSAGRRGRLLPLPERIDVWWSCVVASLSAGNSLHRRRGAPRRVVGAQRVGVDPDPGADAAGPSCAPSPGRPPPILAGGPARRTRAVELLAVRLDRHEVSGPGDAELLRVGRVQQRGVVPRELRDRIGSSTSQPRFANRPSWTPEPRVNRSSIVPAQAARRRRASRPRRPSPTRTRVSPRESASPARRRRGRSGATTFRMRPAGTVRPETGPHQRRTRRPGSPSRSIAASSMAESAVVERRDQRLDEPPRAVRPARSPHASRDAPRGDASGKPHGALVVVEAERACTRERHCRSASSRSRGRRRLEQRGRRRARPASAPGLDAMFRRALSSAAVSPAGGASAVAGYSRRSCPPSSSALCRSRGRARGRGGRLSRRPRAPRPFAAPQVLAIGPERIVGAVRCLSGTRDVRARPAPRARNPVDRPGAGPGGRSADRAGRASASLRRRRAISLSRCRIRPSGAPRTPRTEPRRLEAARIVRARRRQGQDDVGLVEAVAGARRGAETPGPRRRARRRGSGSSRPRLRSRHRLLDNPVICPSSVGEELGPSGCGVRPRPPP